MTEEEEKAIERCKEVLNTNPLLGTMNFQYSDIETVLNLIQKLNNMYIKEYNEHKEKKRQNGVLINNELILKKEIEKYKYLYQKALDNTVKTDRDNLKKDKMIDYMASTILEDTMKLNTFWCNGCFKISECPYKNKPEECIKNYFKKKAEEN